MKQGSGAKAPTVAVIGLGYVGLPVALEFARSGCRVLGVDVDSNKTQQLANGHCYLKHIDASGLKTLVDTGVFDPTTDFKRLRQAQAVVICVPTPVTEAREPDLRYIVETSRTVSRYLERSQLVVLESTTYPGTTEEVVLPLLEESGLKCPPQVEPERPEPDFYLAFSPERIDPGNNRFPLRKIPKVVGGFNPASGERARQLYERIYDKVVVVSSSRVAEMSKLLENIYRSVNIALVNELKLICQRMGIDIWEVIEAAATKPFGFAPFYPGPGLGGHCIPIDPFYLAWKVRQYDMNTRFIELAGEINTAMPYHVVQTVVDVLNARGKAVKGAQILILGVAYKKDVDDIRESPALKIMQLLAERGATIAYNDPHVPRLHRTRKYDFSHLRSVPLDAASLNRFDCVVLVTNHHAYDYSEIVKHAPLIVDTRNATRGIECSSGKVVRC
ncbi:MAG: nucleotide sugar dehydrogenase [Acidobacteriota bacterium]